MHASYQPIFLGLTPNSWPSGALEIMAPIVDSPIGYVGVCYRLHGPALGRNGLLLGAAASTTQRRRPVHLRP